MTHTPIPWTVAGKAGQIMDVVVVGPKSQGICEMTGHVGQDRDADADFVIRAVNNHDALLEALEKLLPVADGGWRLAIMSDTGALMPAKLAKIEEGSPEANRARAAIEAAQ